MRRIRVLIVDDAVVVRRLVADVLAGDPELEVVGVAANGKVALAKIDQLAPDVVTLDVEMPELDGLATLKELRKLRPRLPVIMFSTLTQRGAAITIEALTLGANDYATKPANAGTVTMALQMIRSELIPKIKALGARAMAPAPGAAVPRRAVVGSPLAPPDGGPVRIIAIGCSTGGPNALSTLLARLPADLAVPIVVVQHMPALFTRILAERLDGSCALSVREGAAGEELRPGTVYIAPGGFHMRVEGGPRPKLVLDQSPPRNSCRPAVDVLFESVAAVYGRGVLGVVLTGMGQDGLRGGEHIRECGGDLVAQDEASSVVWGMPGFIVRRGLATAVLPPDQIADLLAERTRGVERAPSRAAETR